MVGRAIAAVLDHGLVDRGDIVLVLAGTSGARRAAAADVLRVVRA
jgi:hypothetical protein